MVEARVGGVGRIRMRRRPAVASSVHSSRKAERKGTGINLSLRSSGARASRACVFTPKQATLMRYTTCPVSLHGTRLWGQAPGSLQRDAHTLRYSVTPRTFQGVLVSRNLNLGQDTRDATSEQTTGHATGPRTTPNADSTAHEQPPHATDTPTPHTRAAHPRHARPRGV